jgi:hypothetical protein
MAVGVLGALKVQSYASYINITFSRPENCTKIIFTLDPQIGNGPSITRTYYPPSNVGPGTQIVYKFDGLSANQTYKLSGRPYNGNTAGIIRNYSNSNSKPIANTIVMPYSKTIYSAPYDPTSGNMPDIFAPTSSATSVTPGNVENGGTIDASSAASSNVQNVLDAVSNSTPGSTNTTKPSDLNAPGRIKLPVGPLNPNQTYDITIRAETTDADGNLITSLNSVKLNITTPGFAADGTNHTTINSNTDTQISGGSIFAGSFPSNVGLINVASGTTTGTGVILNKTGLAGFNSGVKEFYIDAATGKAYFAGTVTAGTVIIGPNINGTGKSGIYINASNYWYDDGKFSANSSDLSIAGKNPDTAAIPGAVSNIASSWKNDDLIITWTFDPNSTASPNNKYAKDFIISLTAGGKTFTDKANISSSGTSQSYTFLSKYNFANFGLFQSQFAISIKAEDTFNNAGAATTATSATYASQLGTPTITATALNNSYSVAYTGVFSSTTQASFSQLVVEESLINPSGTPIWNVVYAGSSNPATINTLTTGQRWIRAKAADLQNTFTAYSNIVTVTPSNPISVDVTTPALPSSVTIAPVTLSTQEIANSTGSLLVSWTLTDTATYSKYGGVQIRYKRTIDSGYKYISVPFTSTNPILSYTILGLIQGTAYNASVAGYNAATGALSAWTDASPASATVNSSGAPSRPQVPTVFAGTTATQTNAGPLAVRVRQYSLKEDNTTAIELFTSYFEIWAIPLNYNSPSDANAQKIGTITAAYPSGAINYNESNMTVNLAAYTPGTFKFYSYAVGNNGQRSLPSALTTGTTIPFMTNAYIGDLSASKITSGTIAALQTVTVGTGTNAIKIASATTDASTYIQSGTSGYRASGFYIDAAGKFSLGADSLYYDGAGNLNISGAITAKSGSFTGNVQLIGGSLWAGSINAATGVANGSAVLLNANGLGIYNSSGIRTTYIASNATGAGLTFATTAASIGNWTVSGSTITAQGGITGQKIVLDNSTTKPSITVTGPTGSYGVTISAPAGPTDNVISAGNPTNPTFVVKADGSVNISAGVTIGGYATSAQLTATNSNVTTAQSDATTAKNNASTALTKASTAIQAGNGVVTNSSGNITSIGTNGITITAGGSAITINSAGIASNQFNILANGTATFSGELKAASGSFSGNISAASGTFQGNITSNNVIATGGTIGGWSLGANYLTSTNNRTYLYTGTYQSFGYELITQGAIVARTYQTGGYGHQASVNYVVHQGTMVPGFIYNTSAPTPFNAVYDLGNSNYRWGTIYATAALNTSDERLKKDISTTTLGLNFINKLNPVSYRMIEGKTNPIYNLRPDGQKEMIDVESIPGSRLHHGFIAQEVKSVLDKMSSQPDKIFAGWAIGDVKDSKSIQMLNYAEFIAPLTKAVQELSNKIDILQAELDNLKK